MNLLKACPICKHTEFTKSMSCVDYTVSETEFSLVDCNQCGFRFTNPIPEENEIGSYYKSEEYVSHSNTSKGLINSLYQSVRKITLKNKQSLLEGLTKGRNVLDIGCGTGELLHTLKQAGWNTVGIEPDVDARKQVEEKGVEVHEEGKLKDLESNSFDIVSMFHVLEHVYHLDERVEEIKRLLKPGGYIVIAVPNWESYDAKKYSDKWAAYDVPRHLYHFRAEDVKTLFTKAGFKLSNIKGMKFDSFYVSMLSEKYKTGSVNLISALLTGLKSNLKAKAGSKPGYSSQIYIFQKPQ